MSGQIIQVQSGQNNVSIGKAVLNSTDKAILSRREFNKLDSGVFTATLTDLGPGILVSAPVNLSSITTDAQTVATITPGFAGRVSAAFAVVTSAVSTAAKAATIGLFIDQVPGTNEVQSLAITGTPTGGTFTLTYSGQTTSGIAFDADAATVQAALVALSNIAVTDVVCTGGALPGTAVTITFGGSAAGMNTPLITATSASLTGGTSPTATVTTSTGGTAGSDGLSATATSGGSIALTSANATPAGKVVPGSRIAWSAANPMDFGSTSVITFITTAAPTAFSEGTVVFGVILDASIQPKAYPGPLSV